LEIRDRAEAFREYCKRRDDLLEAGNRLAGITALCERRIGQELRRLPSAKGRRTDLLDEAEEVKAVPTRAELGISYDQSAAYQELAHPDVAEDVILDAITEAGKEGRAVAKTDIQRAVRKEIDRKRAERGEPPRKPVDPKVRTAEDQWRVEKLARARWSPVMEALEAAPMLGDLLHEEQQGTAA
jgi:hypothetical protein